MTKKFISTGLTKQVQQTRQLPDQSFLIKMNTKIFSLLLQMHLINDDITYYLCIYHFAWEDQRELQGNISYNALCIGQYLDITRESGCRGQYPDIARESGFHLSFEPLFDTKL